MVVKTVGLENDHNLPLKMLVYPDLCLILGSLHSRTRCQKWGITEANSTQQDWSYMDNGCWGRSFCNICVSTYQSCLMYVAELDAKSGASLKLTVLNKTGRIWRGRSSVKYA